MLPRVGAAIPAHRVPTPAPVRAAPTIRAAHIGFPLGVAGIASVLKHFDFISVLDGACQLLDCVQVTGGHFALVCDFVKLFAEHFPKVSQIVHIPSSLHDTRSTIILLFAKLIACALVFFAATVKQQPRGTSTNAET